MRAGLVDDLGAELGGEALRLRGGRGRRRRAVTRGDPRRPPDAAEQVGAEQRFRVRLLRVAETGVPGAPAPEGVAPRDGVVGAHRPAGVGRLVQRRQHVRDVTRVGAVVVQLVGPHPGGGKLGRRGVRAVLHPHGDLLDRGVGGEPGTHELTVVRPVVLGVGRRVDADVAAARGDVGLEGGLLGGVQHVAGGAQEDHGLVLCQVGRGERGGVLGGVDGEVVRRAEVPDGLDADGDRVVPEPRRLGEHEHLVGGIGREGALRADPEDRQDEGAHEGDQELRHRRPPFPRGSSRSRWRAVCRTCGRNVRWWR